MNPTRLVCSTGPSAVAVSSTTSTTFTESTTAEQDIALVTLNL